MRIGLDALFLRPNKVGGTESYLRNLLTGISSIENDNEYYLFTSKNNFDSFAVGQNIKLVKCNIDNSNRLKRLFYQNVILPGEIKKLKLDLMFFPTYTRCLDKLDGIVVVSNIHDLQYKHFPEYFSLMKKMIFNIFYPASIKKSDYLIAISDFVKNDLEKFFGEKYSDKIKTIYNPINFNSLETGRAEDLSKYNLKPKKYFLSVGSLLPHKNTSTLIKAFNNFIRKTDDDYKLVLVGIKEKSTNSIIELIASLNIQHRIIVPGYVSNSMLSSLYKNAVLFISPSIFEGFGMPPIEAMYNKVPVITTKEASLPEVTMNKAFYYYPSKDFKSLSKKIIEVLDNYPSDNHLSELASLVYEKYNKKTIAKAYIDFFESVVK